MLLFRILLIAVIIVALGFLIHYLLVSTKKHKAIAKKIIQLIHEMEKEYKIFIDNKLSSYVTNDDLKIDSVKKDALILLKPHIEALINLIKAEQGTNVNITTELEIFGEVALLAETLLKSDDSYSGIKEKITNIIKFSIDADLSKKFLYLEHN